MNWQFRGCDQNTLPEMLIQDPSLRDNYYPVIWNSAPKPATRSRAFSPHDYKEKGKLALHEKSGQAR